VHTIWTIGHSTLGEEEFFQLLNHNSVTAIADVRRFPASRRHPHFNGSVLKDSAHQHGIRYRHFESLGGRRTPSPESRNIQWKNASFRGYADYMETEEFRYAIEELITLAIQEKTAIMCAEGPWWKCHRSLISDYLKKEGWKVLHILGKGNPKEHPFTGPAKQGVINY
jgi:uncharacterized protein (DUF488 family)